jgi:Winged helix-turn helix
MVEAGLPAVPDVGWSVWDPDGLRWAEWINGQPRLRAVSIYCGGQKIHAERRAHLESVEDLALLHRAVRPEVAFIPLRRLVTTIEGKNPRQLRFRYALWTRAMIQELIWRQFQVSLSESAVGRLLRRIGYTRCGSRSGSRPRPQSRW